MQSTAWPETKRDAYYLLEVRMVEHRGRYPPLTSAVNDLATGVLNEQHCIVIKNRPFPRLDRILETIHWLIDKIPFHQYQLRRT